MNIRKLDKSEISCKVKQVTEKGCLILLYKTARVDSQILDEVFGPQNWTNDFREVKGNLYCGIGIRQENDEFVWKWDCGVESVTEAEKGEASDAFKRAGFKWGIGVELYSAPFIWASVKTVKNSKGSWELANKFTKFFVSEVGYDGDKIISLTIVTDKGENVFSMKKNTNPITNSENLNDVKKDLSNAKRKQTIDKKKDIEEMKRNLLEKGNGIILRLRELEKIPQDHIAVQYSNDIAKELHDYGYIAESKAVLEALDKAVMKIEDINDKIIY